MTALSYPYAELPAARSTLRVALGIDWVRMPLPFALDHINLWLLEDGCDAAGALLWTVVDTGVALDPLKDDWRALLAGHRLTRQIVTHCHPDHLGLAGWLERETGAPLWITLGEYTTAQLLCAEVGNYTIAAMLALFRRHGLDEASLAALAKRGNGYKQVVPQIPSTYRRLVDGERIAIGGNEWRIIVGHGHAPEHAALYCERLGVLISGDMMLPRISTNVSVLASLPDDDPLGQFLDSIVEFEALPADTLVLPSHGRPFCGLHQRIVELQQHHRARCDDLLRACAVPLSAAALIPVLFARPIADAHQTMFAMGEAMAHLNYLEHRGEITRGLEDGIIKFRKTN